MTVIALSGEAGAGKDTIADIIVEQCGSRGLDAEIIRFAQPIKDACYALGVDPDTREQKELVQEYELTYERMSEVFFQKFKYLKRSEASQAASAVWMVLVKGPRGRHGFKFSPRQLQQWIGGAVREVRKDYYVQHLLAECAKRPGTLIVVPDCRYPNEVGVMHTSVYITRPDNPCRINTTDSSEAHQEALADMAEFIIRNESPCGGDWHECLEDQVAWLLIQLTERGYLDDVSTTDAS